MLDSYKLKNRNKKPRITLLKDVFENIPKDQVIQIEIKDQHNDLATIKTVELVKKYCRQSTTILGNLRHEYNLLIRKLDPAIPTFCSWTDILIL